MNQFKRVKALAGANGHMWADIMFDHPEIETVAEAERRRDELLAEQSPLTVGGIWHTPGADGAIRHTTMTGRMSWTVFRDGTTEIELNRPQGVAFTVEVSPAGDVSLQAGDCEWFERHVGVAWCALAVLIGEERASSALAPLYSDAILREAEDAVLREVAESGANPEYVPPYLRGIRAHMPTRNQRLMPRSYWFPAEGPARAAMRDFPPLAR